MRNAIARLAKKAGIITVYAVCVVALGIFWYGFAGVTPRHLVGVPLHAVTLGEVGFIGTCLYLWTKIPWE